MNEMRSYSQNKGALLENQLQTETHNNSIGNVVTAQNYIQTTTWEDQQGHYHKILVRESGSFARSQFWIAFHTELKDMGEVCSSLNLSVLLIMQKKRSSTLAHLLNLRICV